MMAEASKVEPMLLGVELVERIVGELNIDEPANDDDDEVEVEVSVDEQPAWL